MPEHQEDKHNLYTYLNRLVGEDGIKTANKLTIHIDGPTAVTILTIGTTLIVLEKILGLGLKALMKKSIGNE